MVALYKLRVLILCGLNFSLCNICVRSYVKVYCIFMFGVE